MWFGIEDKVAHQSISEPVLVCTSGTALGPVGKQFGLPALLCTGKWPERCLRGGPDQPAQPHGASIPKASKPLKHGEGMVQEWLHGSHLPLCTLTVIRLAPRAQLAHTEDAVGGFSSFH